MSPASGTAITAPRPPPSKIKPSVDGLACSSSRIAGMREAQLAKPKPLLMNAVATARFAVSAAASADTCLRRERSACSGSWGSGSNMTGPRYRPAGQRCQRAARTTIEMITPPWRRLARVLSPASSAGRYLGWPGGSSYRRATRLRSVHHHTRRYRQGQHDQRDEHDGAADVGSCGRGWRRDLDRTTMATTKSSRLLIV